MYAQTSSITPVRSVIRNYFVGGGWPFQLRHPDTWAAVRMIASVWFLTLATVLVTHGFEWGAVAYAAAAREQALGYRLVRTARALRH